MAEALYILAGLAIGATLLAAVIAVAVLWGQRTQLRRAARIATPLGANAPGPSQGSGGETHHACGGSDGGDC